MGRAGHRAGFFVRPIKLLPNGIGKYDYLTVTLSQRRITTGQQRRQRWTGLNSPEGWQLTQACSVKRQEQLSGGPGSRSEEQRTMCTRPVASSEAGAISPIGLSNRAKWETKRSTAHEQRRNLRQPSQPTDAASDSDREG
ncbi:hypothetical protein D9M71_627230 [compost metagenome]